MHKINVRALENIHIPLWILKDICWIMEWKFMAVLVSLPTLAIALVLCLITRKRLFQWLPNISVLFWLCANIVWMFMEFYAIEIRAIPLVFFIFGLVSMVVFYFPKKEDELPI